MKFEKDQTVYLENGQELRYVAAIGERHVVYPVFECDWDVGETLGDDVIVDRVYLKPPLAKYEQDISVLKAVAEDYRNQAARAEFDLAAAKQNLVSLKEKLKCIPALQYIDDLIEGRITHFVIDSFSKIHIETFADAMTSSDRYLRGGMKLMTLYGDSKGDLQWKINRYSDGSGYAGESVHGFPSYELAHEFAAKVIRAAFDDKKAMKEQPHRLGYLIDSAIELGIDPPADLVAARKEQTIAFLRQAQEKAKEVLISATSQLEEAEKSK